MSENELFEERRVFILSGSGPSGSRSSARALLCVSSSSRFLSLCGPSATVAGYRRSRGRAVEVRVLHPHSFLALALRTCHFHLRRRSLRACVRASPSSIYPLSGFGFATFSRFAVFVGAESQWPPEPGRGVPGAMENRGEPADRPLLAIATAWKGLQAELLHGDGDATAALRVGTFSHGCSLISPLFGCLGIAFKFAEKDYVAKVHDLCGAANQFDTLPAMVNQDITNSTVRNGGSHTRNLLRVLRGVDMVRVLFEHILVTEGNSLKEPASKAYDQVFAAHHSWTIRKAVSAGMFMLPTKAQFLKKLHEEEGSARTHIQEFVKSATPVVEYVNNVFVSKELGTDW